MNVLVACEFSGIVREAFRKLGHNAWSCDLLDAEDGSGFHFKGDVLAQLPPNLPPFWHLMIAHPPCTHLAVSGARWFKEKKTEQAEAIEFFLALCRASVPRICAAHLC